MVWLWPFKLPTHSNFSRYATVLARGKAGLDGPAFYLGFYRSESSAAIRKLRKAGFPLLSQTVLLKGVNASVEQLEALFRQLVEMGVKAYYFPHSAHLS
jgi:hypothetical protein